MSIAYEDQKSQKDQTLVFIHAFPLDHTMWKYQLEGLKESARVLAPDIPGFGKSKRLEGTPGMEGYVNALLAWLDSLGIEKAFFGGCSMGGYILFELWRKAAERIQGLILCDTRAEADTPEARQNRLKTIEQVLAEGASALDGMVPKLLGVETFKERKDMVAEIEQIIHATSKEGIADALKAMADRPDSVELLQTISVPVLLLVGEDDQLTPPDLARSMQERLQTAQLQIVPHAGHLSPLEQPAIVNESIQAFIP